MFSSNLTLRHRKSQMEGIRRFLDALEATENGCEEIISFLSSNQGKIFPYSMLMELQGQFESAAYNLIRESIIFEKVLRAEWEPLDELRQVVSFYQDTVSGMATKMRKMFSGCNNDMYFWNLCDSYITVVKEFNAGIDCFSAHCKARESLSFPEDKMSHFNDFLATCEVTKDKGKDLLSCLSESRGKLTSGCEFSAMQVEYESLLGNFRSKCEKIGEILKMRGDPVDELEDLIFLYENPVSTVTLAMYNLITEGGDGKPILSKQFDDSLLEICGEYIETLQKFDEKMKSLVKYCETDLKPTIEWNILEAYASPRKR